MKIVAERTAAPSGPAPSAGDGPARAASIGAAVLSDPESDESLAQRAREGSLAAFGTLVDRYEGRIVGFLSQRVDARHQAEDLAQESFVRAWRQIEKFDPQRRFSTWLFTIAVRIAADHRRRMSRERSGREEAGRLDAARREGGRAARDEDAPDVWSVARTALTGEQFEALWLRYAMEMEIADLAAALGRSRVGTRVLLFRARERITAAIEAAKNQPSGRGPAGEDTP